jgi:hypothetical protein
MTDHDLATLLRDHVRDHEPPFTLSSDTAMALGRRTLVRRRARRGLAGVLVAAAAVATVPLMPWGGGSAGNDDRTGIDPATAYALEHYDAQEMPRILEEHVAAALGPGLEGLGQAKFTAGDGQGNPLPATLYDKASSMEVEYGGSGDRRVRVALMHARSEAEGDARESCADDLDSGYAFSCTVSTGADGDLVTFRVVAMRKPGGDYPAGTWSAVTKEELRTGIPAAGDPNRTRIDPDEVYFQRMVESVHSASFLTNASEIVRAPDLATAQSLWRIPTADMEAIVTDPALVIPFPPIDDRGCQWTLPESNITCSG